MTLLENPPKPFNPSTGNGYTERFVKFSYPFAEEARPACLVCKLQYAFSPVASALVF